MKHLKFPHKKAVFLGIIVLFCVLAGAFYLPRFCFSQEGQGQSLRLISYLATGLNTDYTVLTTAMIRDRETNVISGSTVTLRCDPAGNSTQYSLRVSNRITMDDTNAAIANPGVIRGGANYRVNLNSLSGIARFNNLTTTGRITMGVNNPPDGVSDPGTIRARGKYVYDVAEHIVVIDAEPGDVVVISDTEDLTLKRSIRSFDTKLAGVISDDPKVTLGGSPDTKPLALAGVVRCNAITENGPIKKGDMLVSSSEPGYAMTAGAKNITPGMVIGSALEALPSGRGKIHILVNQ